MELTHSVVSFLTSVDEGVVADLEFLGLLVLIGVSLGDADARDRAFKRGIDNGVACASLCERGAHLLAEICGKFSRIITVEDGTVIGGLYGAVTEFVSAQDKPLPVKAVAIPDRYLSQGTQQELKQECGLTTEELERIFAKEFEKISKKD